MNAADRGRGARSRNTTGTRGVVDVVGGWARWRDRRERILPGGSKVLIEAPPPCRPTSSSKVRARWRARCARATAHDVRTIMPTMQAICPAVVASTPPFVREATIAGARASGAGAAAPIRTRRGGEGSRHRRRRKTLGARNRLPRRLRDALGHWRVDAPQCARLSRQRRMLHGLSPSREAVDGHLGHSGGRVRVRACRRACASKPCAARADVRRRWWAARRAVQRPRTAHSVEVRNRSCSQRCIATPVLARSGNLANSSGQSGQNLQFHPGIAIAASSLIARIRSSAPFATSARACSRRWRCRACWPCTPGLRLISKQRLAEIPYPPL